MKENNMKLCQLIEEACLRYKDKIAFECQNNTVTFNDVEHQSRLFAIWLQHYSGLKAGDRIAIQLPNIIQYPLIAYAALRAGLVIVNTNPLYTLTNVPKKKNLPQENKIKNVIIWKILDTINEFFLPILTGIEYKFSFLSKLSSCNE